LTNDGQVKWKDFYFYHKHSSRNLKAQQQKFKGALAYWSMILIFFFFFLLILLTLGKKIDVIIPVLACLWKCHWIFSLLTVFFSSLPNCTQQGVKMSTAGNRKSAFQTSEL